jgi:predicted  nucleic acid-binding Zn-ribbon protein
MSDQLWAAQKSVSELQARVKELEAEVQLYRDKSERAEAWLGKISSEIQERVLRSSN